MSLEKEKRKRRKNSVIVFVKNPEFGNAKTRIANDVGRTKADQVYHSLLNITAELVISSDLDVRVYYSDFVNNKDVWNHRDTKKSIQSVGDLGKKMNSALKIELERYDRVLLIGSDCPYLTSEILEKAIGALEERDVVIGPAIDGGYYLIGMKETNACLFDDINWSSEFVLKQTIQKLDDNNLSYFLLPELSDIDYWEDWQAFLASKNGNHQD